MLFSKSKIKERHTKMDPDIPSVLDKDCSPRDIINNMADKQINKFL